MIGVKNFIEAILNPFVIFLIILGVSIVFLLLKGPSKLTTVGLLTSFLGLAICSSGIVPYLVSRRFDTQYNQPDQGIHWVVVLGGGQFYHFNGPANQMINKISLSRLIEGIRIYKSLDNAKLVLSGGGIFIRFQRLNGMKRLLNFVGFHPKILFLRKNPSIQRMRHES